ncbi:MAG: hypothetical protein MJK05_05945 [Nitrosopumilus sp.]|nr:hypothetical protein [Nitrosopumilus sp.]
MATDLIDAGIGDEGRLEFILQCLDKNKPLYKTDMIFLESLSNQLDSKLEQLQKPKNTAEIKPEITPSHTLLSDEHLDKHWINWTIRNQKRHKNLKWYQKSLFLKEYLAEKNN